MRETAWRCAISATDEEFDPSGIEHEEILGGISRTIQDVSRAVRFALRKRGQRIDCRCSKPIEQLADIERGGLSREVDRIAVARERIALQRRLG